MGENEVGAAEVGTAVASSLHGFPLTGVGSQRVLHPDRDHLLEVVELLYKDGFELLVDVVGVDYLAHGGRRALPDPVKPERFEVAIVLVSISDRQRLRIRVQVPSSDPVVASLTPVHPSADAFEREVWDMIGVRFDGHPDLSRVLMPEEWDGHPLRKDYSVGAVPVQFKGVAPSR